AMAAAHSDLRFEWTTLARRGMWTSSCWKTARRRYHGSSLRISARNSRSAESNPTGIGRSPTRLPAQGKAGPQAIRGCLVSRASSCSRGPKPTLAPRKFAQHARLLNKVHGVPRVHWVPEVRRVLGLTCLQLIVLSPAEAQESVATPTPTETLRSPVSSQEHVHANTAGGWRFMDSGILYAQFNHQGSARGDDEFVAPSWWMGTASRNSSHGQLTFASMFS